MTSIHTLAAALASIGISTYEPSEDDLELSAEVLAARILERRNAKAGVQYWERATHLLNKEKFRSCR